MKMLYRVLVLALLFCTTAAGSQAAAPDGPAIYFDLEHFSVDLTGRLSSIPPSYQNLSDSQVAATALRPTGLAPGWACCQTGSGYFTFSGWGGSGEPGFDLPAIEFDVTATQSAFTPGVLTFNAFSGLWSDIFGSPNMVDVWASRDHFQTAIKIATHGVLETPPGAPPRSGPFSDDFSVLGEFKIGETLSIRFKFWNPKAHRDAGAGLIFFPYGPPTPVNPTLTLTLPVIQVPASPITYYLSSMIASGSLGSRTLINTPVEFTVESDTSGVRRIEVPGDPSLFYQNEATTAATMTVQFPDGTKQTATFEPASEILVAEDLPNYGVAIGSTTGGHIYPFGLQATSLMPSAEMGVTPVPLLGTPFVCANFDPMKSSFRCPPVPLSVRIGNSPGLDTLLVDRQSDWGCIFTTDCPARGFYAAVTGPTLFVVPASAGGGNISAAGTTLNCPGSCSITVTRGENIQLIATPAPGYAFAAWGGACGGNVPSCTVNISAVVTNVQARFVAIPAVPAIAATIAPAPAFVGVPICSLVSSGPIQCWGVSPPDSYSDSLPTPMAGLDETAVSVANADYATCLVTQSGATKCQGNNGYGVLGIPGIARADVPLTVPGLEKSGVAVAANASTSCALNTSGGLKCWGYNGLGQLGNGTTNDSAAPVQVSGLTNGVVSVVVGAYHNCAIVEGGGVRCWGYNNAGQLGDGTETDSLVPVAVSGLSAPVVAIATGQVHTCALTNSGGVLCWGANDFGQLGSPSVRPYRSYVPVAVSGLASGVIAIAAGRVHTCALNAAGAVKCWGQNNAGQLGSRETSSTSTGNSIPEDVVGLPGGIISVVAGGDQTCAVTRTGAARCWGFNRSFELGNWSAIPNSNLPVTVIGQGRNVVSLSAGLRHTCVVDNRGAAQCWGGNSSGGLGNGTSNDSNSAVAVTGLAAGVLSTTAGHQHSCALIAGGEVQCWGLNDHGQLGDGTKVNAAVPRAVTGLAGAAAAISANRAHTCAVVSTGGVQCWGDNQYGQLGNLATIDSTAPVAVGLPGRAVSVAVGDGHTCALTGGGAVQCWGHDNFGQIGNGAVTTEPVLAPTTVNGLGSGIIEIATGSTHTCALTNLGGVQCWGANGYGQLGNGGNATSPVPVAVSGLTSGVKSISSTANHSCALTHTGAVWCWGSNGDGELGTGNLANSSIPVQVSGLSKGVVGLVAGGMHTCALMSSGTALCWGGNANGQLGNGDTGSVSNPIPIQGLARDNSLVMTSPAGLPAANAILMAGGGTMSLAATASSGLAPMFSTYTPDRCAVSGSTLIPLSPGLCAVQAKQAGSASFDPAPTQTRLVVIGATVAPGQVITFGPAPSVKVGTTGILSAGASSGLPVTLGSLTPGICTVEGFTVTGVAGGSCTVSADQGGNAIYGPALRRTQTFAIDQYSQTIVVDPAPFMRVRASGNLSAVASSGLPVTFSSTTPSICGVSGSVVTGIAAGICGVRADQAGDSRFSPAPSEAVQIVVHPRLLDDFNGDGKSDLLWQSTSGATAVWLMVGTAVQESAQFGPLPGWTVFGGDSDFNANGKSDMVWTSADGQVAILLMDGTSVFDFSVYGPIPDWSPVTAHGDFNGDGKTDLVWTRSDGAIAISLMDGKTILSTEVYGPFAGWSLIGAANDFDGDGRNDLLWRHVDGTAAIWLMNGTAVAKSTTFGPFDGWTVASGDADYNGDGKTDLLWTDTNGAAAILLMNGTTVAGGAVLGPAPGRMVATGRRDFNGDGMSDLLWTHSDGSLEIALMNGTAVLGTSWVGPFPGWAVVPGSGDYDGDGKTDLLWTNTDGSAAIMLMNGLAIKESAIYGPLPGWAIRSDRTGP